MALATGVVASFVTTVVATGPTLARSAQPKKSRCDKAQVWAIEIKDEPEY